MPEPYSLFISDLHLQTVNSPLSEQFLFFIRNISSSCERLYILGDLFEAWLGADLSDPIIEMLHSALGNLRRQGTEIYFMRGNRDFLLTDSAIQHLHMEPLEDPTVISLYGKRWLLTHGDRLCTLDIAYQRYRRIAHIRILKWLILHTPAKWRRALAHKIHNKNPHKDKALNLEYIYADAVQKTIAKELDRHDTKHMIHGHTHRMGVHCQKDNLRMVLGDWQKDHFNYLYISSTQILLKSCPWPEASLARTGIATACTNTQNFVKIK